MLEITLAGNSPETRPPPEHDILEVNHYLMSGLKTSQIDRWFTGSAPQFDPGDLGLPQHNTDTNKVLEEALEQAHTALQDPSQTSWQPVGFSLDRNVHSTTLVCMRFRKSPRPMYHIWTRICGYLFMIWLSGVSGSSRMFRKLPLDQPSCQVVVVLRHFRWRQVIQFQAVLANLSARELFDEMR